MQFDKLLGQGQPKPSSLCLMRVVGTYLAKFLEDLNGIGKRVKKDPFDFAPVADEMAKMLVTSNVEGYT